MTISMMTFSYKEPILAIRLAEENIGVTLAGLIIGLDMITYTLCSLGMNYMPNTTDGHTYGKRMYFGVLIDVVCMLL
jgi:hypothetical protein